MIHSIDVSGPTTLYGIYISALSEAERAENKKTRRSASEFCKVYVREHARLSCAVLRPNDQLLCASVASIRMIDISFNHIYSLEPSKVCQAEVQDSHLQDSSPPPALSSVATAECAHPPHSSTASGSAAGESSGSLSSDSSVRPNAKRALESSHCFRLCIEHFQMSMTQREKISCETKLFTLILTA